MVYALGDERNSGHAQHFRHPAPDTLTEYPNINVAGAANMVYNENLNRLYIAGGQEMEIIFVGQSPPQLQARLISRRLPRNAAPVTATAAAVTDLPTEAGRYRLPRSRAAQRFDCHLGVRSRVDAT